MKFSKAQRGIVYNNIPEGLQDFFVSPELTQFLKKLGDRHNLSEKNRGIVGEEVGLVILGIHPISALKNRLQNRLRVHNDAAVKIAASIQEYIPADIKRAIKNLPKPETLLNQSENVGQTSGDEIPVPPPPGSQDADPPIPDYGGGSDPYREPPE